MKRYFTFAMLLPTILILLPVLAAAQEKQAAIEPAQQKAEYEKSMQERLGNVGRKLDELKADAARQAAETRKDVNRYIARAEKKGEAAKNELAKLRDAANDKWHTLQPRIEGAVHDFEQAFEKAKSRFRSK